MPVFNVISGELNHLKQVTPVRRHTAFDQTITLILSLPLQPQQKRLVDDLERRINQLFDALNCETLSPYVNDQLVVLVQGDFFVLLRYLILAKRPAHSYGCT